MKKNSFTCFNERIKNENTLSALSNQNSFLFTFLWRNLVEISEWIDPIGNMRPGPFKSRAVKA